MIQATPTITGLMTTMPVIMALQLPLCVLFWRRRHLSPIKERMPIRTLLALLSLNVHFVLTVYTVMNQNHHCYLLFIMANYATTINQASMITRFLGYYLIYRLNRAKTLMAATGKNMVAIMGHDLPKPSNVDIWMLRNNWFVTWKSVAPLWIVVLLIITIFNFLSYPYFAGDECDWRSSLLQSYVQVWSFTWALIFIALGIKLRRFVDGFHIQWELTATMKMVLVLMILWSIPFIIDYDKNQFPVLTIVYFLFNEGLWLVTLILPIKWSYGEFAEHFCPSGDQISLHWILDRPDALDAFIQFLAKDFCIESIYFLLSVRRLKEKSKRMLAWQAPDNSEANNISLSAFSTMSESGLQLQINEIYEIFCRQDSPFMINISSSTLKMIESELDCVSVNVFDDAVREIEALLESNSLHRFLQSDLGRPLLAHFSR